jgi:hypothetical protein
MKMIKDAFITDLGEDVKHGEYPIERYGVWTYSEKRQKMQVKETSNDLNYLADKYKINVEEVWEVGYMP